MPDLKLLNIINRMNLHFLRKNWMHKEEYEEIFRKQNTEVTEEELKGVVIENNKHD